MHRIGPLLMLGKVAQAEAEIEVADRIARGLRQPAHLWDVGGAKAMLALAQGRLGEAEELMAELRTLGERAQPEMAFPVHLVQRYTLRDFRGGLEEVEPEMRALAAERPARPVFRCVLAHLHVRSDACRRPAGPSTTWRATIARRCPSTRSGSSA